ncbi:MAG: ATP-binding protein [Chloroflexi bacterium]|nr:MAG: ATP-binding protein [Chloroflexota bacterium]
MLFDREAEIDELNFVLNEPGSQFLIVSGRRRLGKTTLLVEWAKVSQKPSLYWVASRISAAQLLKSFSQAVYAHLHPDAVVDSSFSYPTWEMALQQLAEAAVKDRFVVILDEFAYAAEVEPGLPSILQNVWDHTLKQTQIFLVLCGSHIGMMKKLQAYQAPLFGRITGQLELKPLPFSATEAFLPAYSLERRLAVYAILGGVPGYLECFNDQLSLADNVRRHLLRPTGMFRIEPQFLLQDEVQQPHNYLAILLAISSGHHTQSDIRRTTGIEHVTSYLNRLQELHFVRRDIPATVPSAKRAASRKGRYDLSDPYMRFYYRFIHPHQHLLAQGLHDWLWQLISEQLRAFIGTYAFEELCREWVLTKARMNELCFMPEYVGSHWSREAQIDVVAINWRLKEILLGGAKWTGDPIRRNIVRGLVEKTGLIVPDDGNGWKVHYVFFSRSGFTEAAVSESKKYQAMLVNLESLGHTLGAG